MSAERRLLVLAVTGVLLSLLVAVAGIFTRLEPQTIEIELGPSDRARRDPLLAAERFLARLELPVARDHAGARLRRLPPPGDTLLVTDARALSREQLAALDDWIQAGGRLVLMVTRDPAAPITAADHTHSAAVLAHFDLDLHINPSPRGAVNVLVNIPDPAGSAPLRVTWSDRITLGGARAADRVLEQDERLFLIERGQGDGTLTVLADGHFMTNTAIGELDHALFTARLLAPTQAGRVIWLLDTRETPTLGRLLWSAAPLALVSGALCLLVWVWSLGGRLGPLQEVPSRDRHDLMEHLEASADFLWRHRAIEALLAPTRRRVRACWRERSRAPSSSPDEPHLARRLAETLHVPEEEIVKALQDHPTDPSAFVRVSARLHDMLEARRSPRGR